MVPVGEMCIRDRCSGEHNHEAADEYNEAAEAHSDEIILPKAKAEAAGVKAVSYTHLDVYKRQFV